MKRIVSSEKVRADWVQGIQQFMLLPATAMTFTFPNNRSQKSVRGSLLRFERVVNEHCFGRRFREDGKRLTMVGVIEGKRTCRHIHLIVEDHPGLSTQDIKRLWRTNVCKSTSEKAIDVQSVYDLQGLAGYLTKEVNWGDVETEPLLFGAKNRDRETPGGSRV